MRQMRRKDKQATSNDVLRILMECEYGTLATISLDGSPYVVPLNYVYYNEAIYFHCANVGHKIDNIANNKKACFNVVQNTKVLKEKLSTKYESVTAFGIIDIVIDEIEIVDAMTSLIKKYSLEFIDKGILEINSAKDRFKVLKFSINEVSGKISNISN